MSRKSSILYLSREDHVKVDACVRRHRFVNYSGMQAELRAAGIDVSRSALHRYVQKVQAGDAAPPVASAACVVVIVERASGAVRSLTTEASGEQIEAAIRSLNPPA
ncbi:phage protein Gp27 family protein [Rubrivivax gelatinosus]|uniref:phage protein Gp27 family protein n=1 Tax=Rubrivivax gelatinosus TaxID=28068 RepID=UPI0019057673|nr:phage protein Gp27 family protein [Rubrivivax gelatinosus]